MRGAEVGPPRGSVPQDQYGCCDQPFAWAALDLRRSELRPSQLASESAQRSLPGLIQLVQGREGDEREFYL